MYTVIVVVLFFVVINVLLSILQTYERFDEVRDIQDSAITVMERVVREVRSAQSVSTGGSTFDSHPGTLSLSTLEDGNPVTVRFALSSGAIRLTRGGIDLGPLTSDDVTVTNLVFRRADNTESELIRIELSLQAGERTEHFYTSVVLRGAYTN